MEAPELLNLHRLHCWVTAVEEGSISGAARRLNVPQPAVSQDIRRLENSLGSVLLERSTTGVRLTSAGRALLPDARVALATVARAVRSVHEADGLVAGTLEIVTYGTAMGGYLRRPIEAWCHEHRGVSLRFIERTHRELFLSVEHGVGDFGIGNRPSAWKGPIRNIGWDEFVIVLPAGEHCANRSTIPLESIADREFVSYQSDLGLANMVRCAFRSVGYEPRIAVEVSQVDAAAHLAAAGVGPALVPSCNIPSDVADFVVYPSQRFVWPVAAFTRSCWSKSAEAFLTLAETAMITTKPENAVVVSAD